MNFQTLKVQLEEEGLLKVFINREDKLNALNAQTMIDIESAFQMVYDDPKVKGVIISGVGEKAFVAGADISEIGELNHMNARKFAESGQEIFMKIESCPKPVIAAINGYALGGGCELAMACHIRIASDNAKFGLPEVTLGIIPGYGGTQRLPVLVGKGKAFELIMSGSQIDAEEAWRIGLVNYVTTQEELMGKCENLMHKITKNAGLAIAQVIDCVNAAYTEDDGFQTEANSFGNCCKTDDFKEGTTAFLEKRKPEFQGA